MEHCVYEGKGKSLTVFLCFAGGKRNASQKTPSFAQEILPIYIHRHTQSKMWLQRPIKWVLSPILLEANILLKVSNPRSGISPRSQLHMGSRPWGGQARSLSSKS
jgi:hypothetical protein